MPDFRFVVAVFVSISDVLSARFELQVILDELLVIGFILDKVMSNAVCYSEIAVVAEHDNLVGSGRSARAERRDIVVLHIGVADLTSHDTRVKHRMCLGHVGAPGDEDIGIVDISIAASRLVGLEHVHETHDGTRHAQTSVGIDVVGKQPCLPELCLRIALDDGLLARTPECQAALVGFPGFAQLLCNQIKRLSPCGLSEALISPLQ